MKITSKGQVTIPQAIRQKHGLMPDTEVEFVESRGRVYLEKAGNRRGRKLIESMRGRASAKMSTDQIMTLTRGE